MAQLKNFMESVVEDLIDSLLVRLNCCTCEICRADVMALALNQLPPMYIVTNSVYPKINMLHQQFDVDVVKHITAAAGKVRANPRHA